MTKLFSPWTFVLILKSNEDFNKIFSAIFSWVAGSDDRLLDMHVDKKFYYKKMIKNKKKQNKRTNREMIRNK